MIIKHSILANKTLEISRAKLIIRKICFSLNKDLSYQGYFQSCLVALTAMYFTRLNKSDPCFPVSYSLKAFLDEFDEEHLNIIFRGPNLSEM